MNSPSNRRVITPDDSEWPSQLHDLGSDMPARLWVRDNIGQSLAWVCGKSVAIVGSRACTPYGANLAGNFAHLLSRRGWAVVSGMAFGIDAAAHRGALNGSTPTVAVLPCGVDQAYPSAHAGLMHSILECGGLVVSEYAPGTVPSRTQFLARNRIIAALTRGSVLVEAATLSGSLNEARHARTLGRPVFGVPGPATSNASAGVHQLIRSGVATLVTNGHDVIEGLSA